jgi:general secretion pathway protein L
MPDTLLLRADPVDREIWRWLRLDNEGNPPGEPGAGSLADAAGEAAGLKVVILAPALDCLLTQAQIPGHNRQKLLRAVPYALEEHVSDEVERLHFALGPVRVDADWPVAIIARRYMEELLAEAAAAGLDVQQVSPEQLAIPRAEHEISVLISNGLALVRSGDYSGYAVDSENLGIFLAASAEDTDTVPALQIYLQQGGVVPDIAGYAGEVRTVSYTGDPLTVYARGLDERAINLLQGAYGRSGEWARILRPWRTTAALLLTGVLVSNVAMGVDYFRLNRESEQLRAQIEATYREAFPETRRVVNPRAQMQQQLDRLQHRKGTGAEFLALLSRSGNVLKGIQGIEVNAAGFRDGRLDLDLTATDLQLLDKLKQDLARAGGLKVEIQSATAGADKQVKGRLRIQGDGS